MKTSILGLGTWVILNCFVALSGNVLAAEPTATPVERIHTLPGFQVELLYSVPREEQGSWVSLTVDDKGRLITSDQYGKLFRIVPASSASETVVEELAVDIGMAHGLLYAFDSLYVMVNESRRIPSGLYRVRDTDDDDQFDDVQLLREMEGRGEHGPHAVVLAPDGKSIYVCAGNHTDLPTMEQSTVLRNWQEDLLLPRMWDARGHAVGRLAPGGWIARTDPEGKEFELVSVGYRNEYDIGFNGDGELFTYDSDMEWDIGTPWYRPTRVLHATSGSDFGWRSGTGKWREYYIDSLPSAVDVGPGSPTGVVFGTGARFPEKYQRAFFISDWSYGLIYAVHLEPNGASYRGILERFVSAAPLPVTDLVVNPRDGALYFTIGGRKTQSGLYRVTYAGDENTSPANPADDEFQSLRELRRELESCHRKVEKPQEAVDHAWPNLKHRDRHIRYAARVALEHQPLELWQKSVFQADEAWTLLNGAVALARQGDSSLKDKLAGTLRELEWNNLDRDQQLGLLRAYSLVFARLGQPSDSVRSATIEHLNPQYPTLDSDLNAELSRVLAYLEAPGVVRKSLDLLAAAPTQEEQIHYALVLRTVESGWTLSDRKEYFSWFQSAAEHRGGMSFGGFLKNIRDEAAETLNDDEKAALADVLKDPLPVEVPLVDPDRKFVKKWTVEELLPSVEKNLSDRDFERGEELFAAASCFRCHRFAGRGGISGPDLTGVGGRFNSRDLLESLVEPSRVVSDQYQASIFVLDDGSVVEGRVINLHGNQLMVLTNMLDPSDLTNVNQEQVASSHLATTSMMPEGLLDTLTQEEVLDLVAYLQSGGNPNHEVFN